MLFNRRPLPRLQTVFIVTERPDLVGTIGRDDKLMAYRLQALQTPTGRRFSPMKNRPPERAGDRRCGAFRKAFEAFDERRRTPPFLGRKAVPTVVDHGLGALTCAEFS
jgi:hypothetical protein